MARCTDLFIMTSQVACDVHWFDTCAHLIKSVQMARSLD